MASIWRTGAKQLGQELGVSDCSLGKWKRQYGQQGQAARSGLGAEQSRIEQLERELAAVSRQRDIFEKSLGHLGPGTAAGIQGIDNEQ